MNMKRLILLGLSLLIVRSALAWMIGMFFLYLGSK